MWIPPIVAGIHSTLFFPMFRGQCYEAKMVGTTSCQSMGRWAQSASKWYCLARIQPKMREYNTGHRKHEPAAQFPITNAVGTPVPQVVRSWGTGIKLRQAIILVGFIAAQVHAFLWCFGGRQPHGVQLFCA